MLAEVTPTTVSYSFDFSAEKQVTGKQQKGYPTASLGQLPTVDTLSSLPALSPDSEDEDSFEDESEATNEETRSEPDEEWNAEQVIESSFQAGSFTIEAVETSFETDEKANAELVKEFEPTQALESPQVDAAQAAWLEPSH